MGLCRKRSGRRFVAYARCFGKGRRFRLATEDVRNLPLHGAVMKFHKWVIEERNKHRHPADHLRRRDWGSPFPAWAERRVEGIAIFLRAMCSSMSSVRQLGGLASELAANREKAQGSRTRLQMQQLNMDSLYGSPPLRMQRPRTTRRRCPDQPAKPRRTARPDTTAGTLCLLCGQAD
jgi:hypothetical protein